MDLDDKIWQAPKAESSMAAGSCRLEVSIGMHSFTKLGKRFITFNSDPAAALEHNKIIWEHISKRNLELSL